ncbi:sulfotransferase family protein [Winogradskyella psychrotolerans]|uniref:sulfotransferase family protein n=1 Tax=Winogradskyella psychrotolerans TaxID=1344585 RepID=UPI001C079D16|nr:sulfotransferase [Winogradskyella psychrotolerans]MBU2929543.1 sulfotransferase [Winogradskyella psychrotolerans]
MKIILCAGISVRSGTNFMGSIFSEVPNVSSIPKDKSKGEFPFFRDEVFQKYQDWIANFNKGMFVRDTLNSDKMSPYFGELFLSYLKDEYNITTDVIFVKDPSLNNVEKFFDFFPTGKLIVLTRCAPDLLASSLKGSLLTRSSYSIKKKILARLKYITGYNMMSYAKAYAKHAEKLHKLRRELPGRFYEVKFEDIVENPEVKIPELFSFCEIDYNEDVVEKAVNAKVVGSSYFGAGKQIQNWGKLDKDENFNPLNRYNSWGWLNRFLYNKFANASNKSLGYNHKI